MQLVEEGKLSEAEIEGMDEKLSLYQATSDRARAEIELYEGLTGLEQINRIETQISKLRKTSA